MHRWRARVPPFGHGSDVALHFPIHHLTKQGRACGYAATRVTRSFGFDSVTIMRSREAYKTCNVFVHSLSFLKLLEQAIGIVPVN